MTDLWVEVIDDHVIHQGPFARRVDVRLADGSILDMTKKSDSELVELGFWPYVILGAQSDLTALIQIETEHAFDPENHVVNATFKYASTDLDDTKSIMTARVNACRDVFLCAGWSFNGVMYDSDPVSVQNIAGTMTAITAGYDLPSDFTWRSQDNQDIPFNNRSFLFFFMAASKWRELAYHASWVHKAAILDLTSIADVANYDFTMGWVKGFVLTESGLQPVM